MPDELETVLEMFELKDERRTGWVLRNVEDPESVAAHTWGTATLCLLFAERAGVDRNAAVSMALVHDLGEARTGDVATRAEDGRQRISASEKAAQERSAVIDFAERFPEADLLALWEEYEARETQTARFVKDMDLLDNCLQALAYERADRYDSDPNGEFEEYEDLDEFFATAVPRIRTSLGEDLIERVKTRYEDAIGRECRL